MALIKCPECGKEISEFADHCIGCGCPMSKIKELSSTSIFNYKNIPDKFISGLPKSEKEFVLKIIDNLHDRYAINEFKQYISFDSNDERHRSFWIKRPATGLKICYKDEVGQKHIYSIVSSNPQYVYSRIQISENTKIGGAAVSTSENESKDKTQTFWDKITNPEWRFIDNFRQLIESAFPNRFSFTQAKHYFGIKLKEEKQYRFYFTKPIETLVFRFLPMNSDESKNVYVLSLTEAMSSNLFNIIKNNVNINTKTNNIEGDASNTIKNYQLGFFSSLPAEKQSIVRSFEKSLCEAISPITIIVKDNTRKRTYFVSAKPKRIIVCWFTYKKKTLSLKYYTNPGSTRVSVDKKPTFLDIDTIAKAVGVIITFCLHKPTALNKKEEKDFKADHKAKPLKRNFLFSVNEDEINNIRYFDKKLKDKYSNFETYENEFYYAYKIKNSEFYIFWFMKSGADLVFKYRTNIKNRAGKDIHNIVVCNDNVENIFQRVDRLLINNAVIVENVPKLLPIQGLIVAAIRGKKINNKEKYKTLAEEIGRYTVDYIFNKYKDLKKFKTREEFDKYKNKYSDYTYHGRSFSFKYFTEQDAEYCFKYYIASRLISLIQKYESLMHEKIIVDYKIALEEYYNLISRNSDEYNCIKGITSNIRDVPFEVFEEEIKKYYK